jgi:hypothetical protein
VLVGVDDVEPRVGEEAACRGDQPRPVGAGEKKARCRLLGDLPIMTRNSEIPAQDRIQGQVADVTLRLVLWRSAPGM